MREIKFRAWNKNKGIMAVVAHISNLLTVGEYVDVRMNEPDAITKIEEQWDEGDYIHMQFTGLLDKNGKEIYEGDIVKYMSTWGDTYIQPVVYADGYFVPLVQVEHGYNAIDKYCAEDVEIIGNIHEHPELLGDKS